MGSRTRCRMPVYSSDTSSSVYLHSLAPLPCGGSMAGALYASSPLPRPGKAGLLLQLRPPLGLPSSARGELHGPLVWQLHALPWLLPWLVLVLLVLLLLVLLLWCPV
jgi:hypothetical protein